MSASQRPAASQREFSPASAADASPAFREASYLPPNRSRNRSARNGDLEEKKVFDLIRSWLLPVCVAAAPAKTLSVSMDNFFNYIVVPVFQLMPKSLIQPQSCPLYGVIVRAVRVDSWALLNCLDEANFGTQDVHIRGKLTLVSYGQADALDHHP
ncbi:hypothetical protein EJB05_29990, partial [Eragrostis curvula]